MTEPLVVLGAGVSGLTSALLLAEAGHTVEIWAADLPQQTTSRIAAAFWYPFLVQPEEQASLWGKTSYQRFHQLASVAGSGIILRTLRVLFRAITPTPVWADYVYDFRRLPGKELPPGYQSGFSLTSSVIEMPLYLAYLQQQLLTKGVTIEQRVLKSVPLGGEMPQVLVNCTGLGSRELFADVQMFAVRGQVSRVQRDSRGEESVTQITFCPEAEAGPTYIVPRSSDLILGGTSERTDSLLASEETATTIASRCQQLEPSLKQMQVLESLVGLRPGRSEVRLEIETLFSQTTIVHNYGHGGAGVTLSWGCAEEVVRLVNRCLKT